MKNVASKINLALMRLQWKMKFSFLYRLSKNTEQSEYMWWPHMAFFLEIRWKSSKIIRTLFKKSWCPTPCHNLPTRLFYLNICMSSTSVVIFHFLTKFHSFTLFKNENEWQKTEPLPIQLPRAFRNFPIVKTRNKKRLLNIGSQR